MALRSRLVLLVVLAVAATVAWIAWHQPPTTGPRTSEARERPRRTAETTGQPAPPPATSPDDSRAPGDVREPGAAALAVVAGSVQEAEAKQPLAGVRVGVGAWRATSGADGAFEIDSVPHGTQRVTATCPGFAEYRSVVDVNEPRERLDIALSPGIELQGHVLSADGTASTGARVEIFATWLANGFSIADDRETITDASGQFHFAGLDRDRPYTARAWTPQGTVGYVEIPTGVDAGTVEVTIVLQATCRLRGRVVERSGRPLPNVDISVTYADDLNRELRASLTTSFRKAVWGFQRAKTDDDGRFSLRTLRPGKASVVAQPPETSGRVLVEEVSLSPNRITTCEFVVEGAAPVRYRGRVRSLAGNPLSGVRIEISGIQEGIPVRVHLRTTSDKSGDFEFEPVDWREVEIRSLGGPTSTSTPAVPARHDAPNLVVAQPLATSILEIEVYALRGWRSATLSLKTAAAGTKTPQTAWDNGPITVQETVRPGPSHEFVGLQPGRYVLQVADGGKARYHFVDVKDRHRTFYRVAHPLQR